MNLLAIDTSTISCSVALRTDQGDQCLADSGSAIHAQRLLAMVDELISNSDSELCHLDALVCGIGPGSFTGLRVGVGVVQGLAFSQELKVFGLNSLMGLLTPNLDAGLYAVATDARMGQIYSAGFNILGDGSVSEQVTTGVFDPTEMDALYSSKYQFIGAGWDAYKDVLSEQIQEWMSRSQYAKPFHFPKAEYLLHWASQKLTEGESLVNADQLLPFYVRNNVADKPRNK